MIKQVPISRRIKSLLLAAILLSASLPALTQAKSETIDESAGQEAIALLQAYLRVDTTNPPGHERRAADFFKAIFDREGIENEIFDQGGDRANILARLPGNGKKRPLLLLNHLDVVPPVAARWQYPPFSGQLQDGYIWGRGAVDMKTTAICQMVSMLLLKRAGAKLDRDIIFFGSADEEVGSANGVNWMIAHHREELLKAEFVLTEGSSIQIDNGKTQAWNVAATEKSILWLRLIASGKAGHASIPETDGAVAHLIRAVDRIQKFQTPARLLPSVEKYFRELAETSPPELSALLADPAAALRDRARAEKLLSDPNRNAYLRSTISVTGLTGSDKVNVIPGEATATLDCRLLPGDDPGNFLAMLKAVVGDATIKFEVISASRPTESTTDTDLFKAILRVRDQFEPGVPVLTPPLTSTTDASALRELGMVVYGFEPYHLSDADDSGHDDNERISVGNVRSGLAISYSIIADVCGAQKKD